MNHMDKFRQAQSDLSSTIPNQALTEKQVLHTVISEQNEQICNLRIALEQYKVLVCAKESLLKTSINLLTDASKDLDEAKDTISKHKQQRDISRISKDIMDRDWETKTLY